MSTKVYILRWSILSADATRLFIGCTALLVQLFTFKPTLRPTTSYMTKLKGRLLAGDMDFIEHCAGRVLT